MSYLIKIWPGTMLVNLLNFILNRYINVVTDEEKKKIFNVYLLFITFGDRIYTLTSMLVSYCPIYHTLGGIKQFILILLQLVLGVKSPKSVLLD